MECKTESFQTVTKTIDLQNHKATVLGHCRASSLGSSLEGDGFPAATGCALLPRKHKV